MSSECNKECVYYTRVTRLERRERSCTALHCTTLLLSVGSVHQPMIHIPTTLTLVIDGLIPISQLKK